MSHIIRTFKHSALIDLDLASFSDGEVGHCGYSGKQHIYGHFMRSFGVIKPTGKKSCSDVNDTETWWNQVRRHTDPSSRFRKRFRSRRKLRSNKKGQQKSRNRRSVATFNRRYVNRNKAKWSEIRELVRFFKTSQ